MTLERRLRQHFEAAGDELSEPSADLQRVVQRGKRRRSIQTSAVAAGTLSLALVAVLGLQAMTRSKVEFAPVASPAPATPTETPASEGAPTPTPTDAAGPSPAPSSEPTTTPPPDVETVGVRDLGQAVLVHESRRGSGVRLIDSDGESVGWSGSVIAAFPDGRNGFVVQSGSREVVWVPLDAPQVRLGNVADPDNPGGREVTLRGVDPDGTVIFSTRPAKRYDESIVERFFTVALDPRAEPTLLAEEAGYESWYVGPAAVTEGRVIASCHLLCSLWRWPEEQAERSLYDASTAIEGMASTPNRTLLAFVESNEMTNKAPQLVVLDAATFKRRLRLELPVAKETSIHRAVVSLSSDGQRILVSVDAPPPANTSVPRTTYLVDDALTDEPGIRKVDFPGVVRWHPGSV